MPKTTGASSGRMIAPDFYSHLLAGDIDTILDTFEGEPSIDSPHCGAVVGRDAVRKSLNEELSWIRTLGASTDTLRNIKVTRSPQRVIEEVSIHLSVPPMPRPIIFAAVADLGSSGICDLRLYYCYGLLSGNRDFLRASMLPPEHGLLERIPQPVRTYVDGIAAADFDVWKLFAEGASVTGPPNIPLRGCNLVRFYAIAMAEDGGVPLQPATVTSDGRTCAIEENLDSWGSIKFDRSTAGLGVFDYNDSGRLTAARIYDDIPVNPISKPGWIYRNWNKISTKIAEAGCATSFVPTSEMTPPEVIAGILT